MPTTQTQIWLALKSRIATLVTAPVMSIYGPDAVIDATGPYVLVSDVRNTPLRFGISNSKGLHGFSGTLILAIHYPITAPGITHERLLQMGGVIAEHFKADTRMSSGDVCLRVTDEPDVVQPYRQDANRVVLVRVPWSSF